VRISKKQWYRLGGFTNTDLYRKADKLGRWMHFMGATQ
jgi:hypothetical protein